jgi:hypothetical protein
VSARKTKPEAGPPTDVRAKVDEFLDPFFSEPGLWPVLISVLGVLATFGAVIGILAVRERNPAGMLALALVAVMTGDLLRGAWRSGRLGPAAWLMLALWSLSAAGAWLASWTGIF